MLGKLYITANSSPEKLQSVHELVIEAMDGKVATDAPSRNALTKLSTALGKVLGEVGTIRKSIEDGVTALEEEMAVAEEDGADALALGSEEETKTEAVEEGETERRDSLLDELLDDEEDDLS